MTSEVINFDFRNNDVRVIEKDGEPWFVARDVCGALDLQNPAKAALYIDQDRKNNFKLGNGPGRGSLVVNEAGLYDLILQSRKPQAREFKRWVTGTVLPAIRKDGAYVMGEEKVATGEMSEDEFVLKAMNILQTKVQRLEAENKQLKPKADTYDAHFGGARMSATVFVKETLKEANATKVLSDLGDNGYLYRLHGHWTPYKRFIEQGLFEVRKSDKYGTSTIYVGDRGKELLVKLFNEGKLTIKAYYRKKEAA